MSRGLLVAAPPRSSSGAALLLAPLGASAPAASWSGAVAVDWRAVFGASAVRRVLERWPGAAVSSFVRSPAHNAAVGGRVNSFHLVGLAADFVVPPADRSRFVAWARETWPTLTDVIDEGDHVHIEWETPAVTPLAALLALGVVAVVVAVVFSR